MKKNLKPGYVSVLTALSLSAILLIMLTGSYRFSIQNQQTQKKTQIRIDYTNKEQALLRSILTGAPTAAISNMMRDSDNGDWQAQSRWRWVFEYGRTKADGETSLDGTIAEVLGISGDSISGNTGDGNQDHIKYSVDAVTEQSANHWFYINSGTNSSSTLLGPGYPEALILADTNLELLDRDRPIIGLEKTYSDGSRFKLIPYPKVHFGYSVQGQNFMAKRNWWAFSITTGKQSESLTGVTTQKKNFVLSIYEVPSQLALGSTADTLIGEHENGSSWGNVNISGGVYATKASLKGAISLDRIAARRGISLSDLSTVGDVTHDSVTGDRISREAYEAAKDNFFPISNSSESGLVAFLPITRGAEIFDEYTNTTDPNSSSPTGWNYYSRPALQCVMKLRVEDVISIDDQTPTSISFTYMMGGIEKTDTFTRGNNWPTADSSEGATFPFHLESTKDGRRAITVHAGRLASYLTSVGADSLEVNNSIVVSANYRDNVNINKPNIPSLNSDIALVFRDTKDFTAFPKGFSLVTPFRMYFANDLNIEPSGVDASGNEIFPPISLFAPEKRFGIRTETLVIDFKGQVNHVGKSGSTPANPLDFRSGINGDVVPENIQANLHSISSLSQLPPINQMNWLVVIEQVD